MGPVNNDTNDMTIGDRIEREYQDEIFDWMVEHGEMGIPDADSIRSFLRQSGVSFRELSGESWVVHFFVTLLISLRMLNNLWRKVFQNKGERARKLGRIGVLSGRTPYRKLWIVNRIESESKEG